MPARVDWRQTSLSQLQTFAAKHVFTRLAIEPERAGLEVARLLDGLLVERAREPGSRLRLALEIEGPVEDGGYPEDVGGTVKANARDLRVHENHPGFEEKCSFPAWVGIRWGRVLHRIRAGMHGKASRCGRSLAQKLVFAGVEPRFTRESGSCSGVEGSIPAVEPRGVNRGRAPPSFL